jgi:hypothetical protein
MSGTGLENYSKPTKANDNVVSLDAFRNMNGNTRMAAAA